MHSVLYCALFFFQFSIKTGFKSLVVNRFRSSEKDDPCILYLSAQTKAKSKVGKIVTKSTLILF